MQRITFELLHSASISNIIIQSIGLPLENRQFAVALYCAHCAVSTVYRSSIGTLFPLNTYPISLSAIAAIVDTVDSFTFQVYTIFWSQWKRDKNVVSWSIYDVADDPGESETWRTRRALWKRGGNWQWLKKYKDVMKRFTSYTKEESPRWKATDMENHIDG